LEQRPLRRLRTLNVSGSSVCAHLGAVSAPPLTPPRPADAALCALLSVAPPELTHVDATFCAAVTHASVEAATLAEAQGGCALLVQRLPVWFAQPWTCTQHANVPVGAICAG